MKIIIYEASISTVISSNVSLSPYGQFRDTTLNVSKKYVV